MIRFIKVIALLACGVRYSAGQAPSTARQEYDAYLAKLKAAVLAGDAEAVGNLVTPDRVAVSGVNGNTVRGRAAQVAADRVFFRDSRVVSFEMRVTAFSAADSLAYAAGVGTHTVINPGGVSRVDRFQYVDILVRGSDGQWRSRYFMNAPPEPAR